MKVLESYGIQELNTVEMIEVDGGWVIEYLELCYEVMKLCHAHGDDYSGNMHVIP